MEEVTNEINFENHEIIYNISDLLLSDKDNNYTCSICKDVLLADATIKTPCQHLFCKKCIDISLNTRQNCPLCRTHINYSFILNDNLIKKVNLFAYNIISNIQLKCPHNKFGCKKIINNDNLNNHIKNNCKYRLGYCKYCLKLHIHLEHLKHIPICKKRPVKCDLCNKKIPKYLITNKKHYDVCPNVIISCPFKCNIKNPVVTTRNEMKHHLKFECPFVVITCPLKKYGCKDKFIRKNKKKHFQDNNCKHINILCKHIDNLEISLNNMFNSTDPTNPISQSNRVISHV